MCLPRTPRRALNLAVVDWLFRDRTTGKIAIVQVPNVPLTVFFVVLVLRIKVTRSCQLVSPAPFAFQVSTLTLPRSSTCAPSDIR